MLTCKHSQLSGRIYFYNIVAMDTRVSLMCVVEKGDKELLLEKLEEIKAQNSSKELLERNQYGHGPLDIASLLGKKDLVQLLLEHGAEVNSANKSGRETCPMQISA